MWLEMERACAVINGRNEKSQNDFGFLQVSFEIAAVGGLWAKKNKSQEINTELICGRRKSKRKIQHISRVARCWMKLNRDDTLRDQQCSLQILTFKFRR